MGYQNELLVSGKFFLKNLIDLITQLCPSQRRMRDSERYGHQLNGNNSNLIIRIVGFNARRRVKLAEEIRVGIKTNTNAVDENNRKLRR
jgi:hypothetical protein